MPLPGYASDGAAGLDLLAAVAEPMELAPGARKLIPTGIMIALPAGYEAQVRPRSGLALKHGVTLLNSLNDSVSVFLDENTHYPVKISYSWRDSQDKQKNVEDEVYDNYKLVQGIWTAHSITRYFNGETSQQRFVNTASYNLKLADSLFEAAVTYDPKAPLKKR